MGLQEPCARQAIPPLYHRTITIIGNGAIAGGITIDTPEWSHIPVPPLEVQRETVGVLGILTRMEAELERRQQHEHYRDRLLSFPEAA